MRQALAGRRVGVIERSVHGVRRERGGVVLVELEQGAAQVIAAGDAVQLSFAHPSQAVVSGALGKLEQQGWQFTQLSMQQDLVTKAIQVQATVTS